MRARSVPAGAVVAAWLLLFTETSGGPEDSGLMIVLVLLVAVAAAELAITLGMLGHVTFRRLRDER